MSNHTTKIKEQGGQSSCDSYKVTEGTVYFSWSASNERAPNSNQSQLCNTACFSVIDMFFISVTFSTPYIKLLRLFITDVKFYVSLATHSRTLCIPLCTYANEW